ncbi:peptidyl-tRNA hydrolase [Corynebacterium jeddahense]|uniref:peptidyl-tRNA hydrolase n=1 Tax=Corynebacterium jeddahense TaxID=1414719 RepID=A0ABY7ULD9_9CORY|nr:peptidyl-tRNA hydrolase [Corynebacterium jeddahense]
MLAAAHPRGSVVAVTSPAIESAHDLLRRRLADDARERAKDTEDPADSSTVQAMQLAINLPKQDSPSRNQVLNDAARAAVAVCLDPRAGEDGFWRDGLDNWYSRRIRKVVRRARNKAWDDVQALPGITVGAVRAFVPSAVGEVPHAIAKLQIKGTDIEPGPELPSQPGAPLIAVDASLGMTAGKAAAQVGHASMLLAAARDAAWALAWAAAGFPLTVREVPRAEFAELCRTPGAVPVRDAGFTEVAPGSTTVVAIA